MKARITVAGYLFEPTGMGTHMRAAVRALRAAGLAPALIDVSGSQTRDPDQERAFAPDLTDRLGETNIFCVNGDEADRVVSRLDRDDFAGGRNIIYPAWELARYPKVWVRTLERFDEIWAPSAFVRDAIASAVDLPVLHMPLPVEPKLSAFLGRRYFGLPEDAFVVLFFFDFASYASRKNPQAVLTAFEDLAARRPDAPLHCLIKTRGVSADPEAAAAVQARVAALGDRARMMHADLGENEIRNLVRACDVFVSLHRAEGFGLGIAEAMAMGRPAIATGYSGNLDFMAPGAALLTDHRLVPVPPGAYPQGDGQVWAEADTAHAARLIEGLLDDPAGAWALGRAARRHMGDTLSYAAVGARYAERLQGLKRPTGGSSAA